MKKALPLAFAIAGALSAAGCQTESRAGGAVTAGADAVVTAGSSAVAIAGVAVKGVARGSMTDAIVGAPPRRCAKWDQDIDGKRICTLFL